MVMKITSRSLSVAIASVGVTTSGWAQPQVVLSWVHSCPTVQRNESFTGPGIYTLWVGAKNLTPANKNYGFDVRLFYGPTVPDAWRFDDGGCQTGSQVVLDNLPN